MCGRTHAAVVVTGVLCTGMSGPPSFSFLTIPQQDRARSRSTAATASISGDGRYLAFTSYARLSTVDVDDLADVYVLDRVTHQLTLESESTPDVMLAGDCHHPSISGDGRYVVFEAALSGPEAATNATEVVLRDRAAATIRRISAGAYGASGNGWSGSPAMSGNGRRIVFTSTATNLVPDADDNGHRPDIFLFDLETTVMRRISVDSSGRQYTGSSVAPALSADGRRVAFSSIPVVGPGAAARSSSAVELPAVYVRDTRSGQTLSIASVHPPNGPASTPAISADGQVLVFVSRASNLIAGDRNRSPDVFLYDFATRVTTLVSRGAGGGTANGASISPSISGDGRFVAFQSDASDMACTRCAPEAEDINLVPDVFLFDRLTGSVTCVSTGAEGGWMEESGAPVIDATGRIIAFTSRHPISPRDTAFDFDLFVRLTPPSTP